MNEWATDSTSTAPIIGPRTKEQLTGPRLNYHATTTHVVVE